MALMTSEEFCQKLLNIVNRNNYYFNRFPYNLGYFDGFYISFDCWNLVKALINEPSIDQNYTIGHHAPAVGNMPDWDGWSILQSCSGISKDFSSLKRGEYLYMAGHAGVYLGSGVVCECTTDFGCDGVILSNITSSGGRYRGGFWGRSWEYHGMLTEWIDYSVKPSGKIAVDGECGPETVRAIQKVLKVEYPYLEVDGIISSQEISCKPFLIAITPDAFEFVMKPLGSPTIKALQNNLIRLGFNAGEEDGIMGPATISALQSFLKARGYNIAVDGYFGSETVTAYQQFLNSIIK